MKNLQVRRNRIEFHKVNLIQIDKGKQTECMHEILTRENESSRFMRTRFDLNQ